MAGLRNRGTDAVPRKEKGKTQNEETPVDWFETGPGQELSCHSGLF
jgi:hypothetical protein